MKLRIEVHEDPDGEARIDIGAAVDGNGNDADDTITIGSSMPKKREKDRSTAGTTLRAIVDAAKSLDVVRAKLAKMEIAEKARLDKALKKAAK